MIPQKLKISRPSFPPYREQKRAWTGNVIKISCYGEEGGTEQSFAVVVSKKQFSAHVQRNYFKRIVFNEIKRTINVFKNAPFGKFVFYPIGSVESITPHSIEIDVAGFVKQYAVKETPHSPH